MIICGIRMLIRIIRIAMLLKKAPEGLIGS